MATRPKAVIESRNGEKFSPITITKNVLTDDGQNLHDILSDRKEDMMTPTIENSSSMFKVGQGGNVDYSSNVINGAYESMVLKGKTMVNCIQEPSSKDVVLPYAFADGQCVTINDTKESGTLGVELKGQTLVNIHKLITPSLLAAEQGWYENLTRASGEISFDVLSTPAGWRYINAGYLNYQMLKPNTKYLVVFESSQNLTSIHFLRGDGLNGFAPSSVRVQNNKAIITTNSQIVANEQILYVNFYAEPNTKVSFKNPMIIEYQEGMENWDIPYFTGMTSCKMPSLHTVGNLFDAQQIIPNSAFTYSHSTNTGRFEFTNRGDVVTNTNIQLPAGTYDISFLVRGVCENGRIAISFKKDGEAWHACSRVEVYYNVVSSTTFKKVKSKITFDAPVTVTLVGHAWAGGATGSGWCELKDIRFTPVGKTSILSLPEEVVLRSLPNGVCDTFNTKTGVYTQRIKEAAIDNSFSLFKIDDTDTHYGFGVTLSGKRYNHKTELNVICNKLPSSTSRDLNMEYIHSDGWNENILVWINKSKLEEGTLKAFREFLNERISSGNPYILQYELAEPIITKVPLSQVLKSWNTTTHIYSEIPENTLYPTLTRSNPTYPVILKPSTKYSIVANSYSNNHTNSAINFNLGGATASTTVGNRVTTITTPSTLSNELLTMSGRGNKLNNVMVIERDVVGDEPYFEGICDCKSPILSNVGANIFDFKTYQPYKASYANGYPYQLGDSIINYLEELENGFVFTTPVSTNHQGACYYVKVKRNTDYYISCDVAFTGTYAVKVLGMYANEIPLTTAIKEGYRHLLNRDNLSTNTFQGKFNTKDFDCLLVYLGGAWEQTVTGAKTITFTNIQIKELQTPYEPYKSNTTTFDQKDGKTIVLRSLDKTHTDTLNVETGEYVSYVKQVVLTGSESENWSLYHDESSAVNPRSFYITLAQGEVAGSNQRLFLNDKYPIMKSTTQECAWYFDTNGHKIAFTDISKRFANVSEWRNYLKTNPITLFYTRLTPIVSTIDVQGFPYAYKDGHVQLTSGHSGQSLTPKVEYSVATNRNGQIRSNQKMVERHQKQLDRLQAMILTNLVNTQYEQALTNLKYDLKNVREEVK